MSKYTREQLQQIKSFPALVKYLQDELEWPVTRDSFDDLTFDYEPEELGIDSKTAAKIEQIKQLRPLNTNQPWGIFFVKFEPKRLPVVALRRILSQLVIKKRTSAKKSEQASWNLHDLLFISNYGEGEGRQITFAQFAIDENTGGSPVLRVLGWDDADTALHLDHVHTTLKEKLQWPADTSDVEGWRNSWSAAFTLRHREVITTSKELAESLAVLAISIRKRANKVMDIETEKGALRKLYKAFQQALIHDLSEDDFADMYAQTITYGLLAARVSRPMGIISENLSDMVPITNPFLKDMLNTFLNVGGRKHKIDFDELGIQEVVELLNNPTTHIEAILRDFGNRTRQEDPVIHFYEFFLTAYDKKKKVERGVFYTPQPVVSFIVRRVHELLKTEFGLEDGLADITTWGEINKRNKQIIVPQGVNPDEPFVLILDIATGTATFLVEVIDVIYNTMYAKWEKQGKNEKQIALAWNEYVPKHLLPRLYGFELMMAPYSIAHMKIGLKLAETGYRFSSTERVHVYLTNTLEPHSEVPQLRIFSEALAKEADAVSKIKKDKYFTVFVGNPPYSKKSKNTGYWITELLKGINIFAKVKTEVQSSYYLVDGKPLNERQNWLRDDYVKFIRFAQWKMQQIENGVIGIITNHTFLDNITFRGMRQSLLNTFDHLYFLDLHGSAKRQEGVPVGLKNENVFDIEQGVSISFFVKKSGFEKKVFQADIWGSRIEKYRQCFENSIDTIEWKELKPTTPHYFFVPRSEDFKEKYKSFWSVTKIFRKFSLPLMTGNDPITIDFKKEDVEETLKIFKSKTIDEIKSIYKIEKESSNWTVLKAKKDVIKTKSDLSLLNTIAYRPFDKRISYFTGNSSGFHSRPGSVSKYMLNANIGLLLPRQLSKMSFQHVFCTDTIPEMCCISTATKEQNQLFPLYLFHNDIVNGKRSITRETNFTEEFTDFIIEKYKIELTPEQILGYIYAVLHSETYRENYFEDLKIDFARIPFDSSIEDFISLSDIGTELINAHLLKKITGFGLGTFIGEGSNTVEKVVYNESTKTVSINKIQYFDNVSPEIYEFKIGGYEPIDKYLKSRKDRTLSLDEIKTVENIINVISFTIDKMTDIEELTKDWI